MAIDRSISSGSTMMLLLKLLSEKNMYGYEIIETLKKRSQNVFEMKAGTLYPLLHQLEEKNLLTVYDQEFSGKIRKYYSITKEGRKVLEEKSAEWNRYVKAVLEVMNSSEQAMPLFS